MVYPHLDPYLARISGYATYMPVYPLFDAVFASMRNGFARGLLMSSRGDQSDITWISYPLITITRMITSARITSARITSALSGCQYRDVVDVRGVPLFGPLFGPY